MFGYQAKKFLIPVLVFLLPTQLAYHFWPSYSFIFGVRVDYLSPAIYLTDLLILILVLINYKKLFKYKKAIFFLLLFGLLNSTFSILTFVSFFHWIKIFEFVCLAIVIKGEDIAKPLYYSLIFFSLIGMAHFFLASTTGLFYLLGERSFNISTPGIALTDFFGKIYMRAYSTFPHPNSMAGYLGLSTIFLIHKKYKFNWMFGVVIICFVLTFSLSAVIGMIIYFLFKNKFNKYFVFTILLLSLLLPFVLQYTVHSTQYTESIGQRLTLAQESGRVIADNFWVGSGLGTFVKFSSIRQPVHNLFLLIFSELGIFGIAIASYLLIKNYKRFSFLLFILVIGLFDHYFLTIQQNMLLLSIMFALW